MGGTWRGRRLAPVGAGDTAAHLRPTTDRVRENLFNLLMNGGYANDLLDADVLDVFAGTGALGLEALSRGARIARFLETGRTALALLRENIRLLDASAEIIARDARRPGPGRPHGLIFMDPPYGKGLGEKALAALTREGWIAPSALLIWEERVAPDTPDGWKRLDDRTYGDTAICLLRYEAAARV